MAKADDIYALARYASEGNHDMAAQAIRCIAANEPVNSTLKDRLNRLLQRRAPSFASALLPKEMSIFARMISRLSSARLSAERIPRIEWRPPSLKIFAKMLIIISLP